MQLQSERDVSEEHRVKIRKIGPYILIKPIGKGSYATVYQGKIETTGGKVAIKQIALEKVKKKDLQRLQFQIKILTLIKHQNIVNLLDYKQSERNLYLVFEHCQHTDLQKHIKKYYKGKMPEFNVRKIFLQIKKAFQVLRTNKIVHRDLKLANILLTQDFIIKVADFGFAKLLQQNSLFKSVVGTPLTMAPEVLQKKDYDQKCDIWSLGIILYQMLMGKTPYVDSDHMTVEKLKINIRQKPIIFDAQIELSVTVKDLIKKMLVIQPKQRMTFEQFFNHEWMMFTQPCVNLIQLRDMMLQKQVGKSIYSKNNRLDIMCHLKYFDKILVYKLFQTIKQHNQNLIYSSFSLAKRLIALTQEQDNQLTKQLLFIGLLILLNNVKQTEYLPKVLLLNNVSINIDSYDLMKKIKLPQENVFSQSLPALAKKTISNAIQTLKSLLTLPHIQKIVSQNSILLKQYINLLIQYLQNQPKKQILGVLADIKPSKLHRLKLSSDHLNKDLLKIINKPVIWSQLSQIREIVKDNEFIKVYNLRKKMFKIEVMEADKHSQQAQIEEFYETLKEII